MTDLDRTLATLLGEELAQESDLIPPPPPLADLRRRAAHHRRRRWGAIAVAAAAAAVVGVTAVQLWPGGIGGPPLPGPAGPDGALPDGAETFEVPTYDWDGSGMDALVSGRLGFTPEGCTLMYQEGQPGSVQPVVFPDAVGVRFANGVRAVVAEGTGRVFAVEGQQFAYGGGWISDPGVWTGRCGAWEGDVAWINDQAELEPLTTDPPPPDEPVPTAVASDEERGLYDVPTFGWDPAQGGEGALLEGNVTMTQDGCAVVAPEDAPAPVVGLVLPNARGMRGDWPGGAAIMATFPDGVETVMAHDDLDVSFGGGYVDPSAGDDWGWARLCPGSPVDELFLVQDNGL